LWTDWSRSPSRCPWRPRPSFPARRRSSASTAWKAGAVTALWEGILVSDLLDLAKARPAAKIAIFHAADGYTTSLPLDYLRGKKILLADTINGIVLPQANGYPFQLAAEAKWGYKWIRWVTRIELSDNTAYKGYWEKQGYSNKGDASGPMFGD